MACAMLKASKSDHLPGIGAPEYAGCVGCMAAVTVSFEWNFSAFAARV
jgi:hypothetical protein